MHYLCWDIRGLEAAGDHAALTHDTAITPYKEVCVCGALTCLPLYSGVYLVHPPHAARYPTSPPRPGSS